ncbi:EthD family reductase [Shimazuella kribbensis]|uniref:EthD family reductase n=1 Tax=Shimazuella kribbensis TaxID=139808 RepID=UPI00041767B1|nr:EthD family reductase [Shimazuella kribbensis]
MIKIQGLYKNVWDLDEFEKYYTKVLVPKILSIPGIIKMHYTNLYHSSDKQPEGLNDIHVMTETYFESVEVMRDILSSEEGIAITKMITALSEENAQIASYIAQEKVIYAPKWIEKKAEEGEIIEIVDLDSLDLF